MLRPLALLLAIPTLTLAAEPVVKGDLGRRLDRTVQASTNGGFWGAVLVARGDEVLLAKGYGNADYERTPITPDTLFEVASLTKHFTAAAILKLERQRKLATSDSIARFLPRVPEEKRAITIHHLLTHASGISPDIGLPYGSPATLEEMVANALAPALVSPQGARFEYCNVGYALLAAIVEKASGRSFETYCKEELFLPAGMKDSGFLNDPALDARRAALRVEGGQQAGTAIAFPYGWGYRGMGGMVSTARDLHRWDRALRTDKPLDAEARRKQVTPATDGVACGCFVREGPGGEEVSHSGSVAGFGCNFARLPGRDAVVIVLSNGAGDPIKLTAALEEALFPAPRASLSLDLSAETLSEHAHVEVHAPGLQVKRDGATVRITLDRTPTPLTLALPADAAPQLLGPLAKVEGEAAGADAAIYVRAYELDGKELELSGLTVQLLPRYVYQDENGKQGVDPRPTLVLVDEERGSWPLILKLSPATARALAKAVAAR